MEVNPGNIRIVSTFYNAAGELCESEVFINHSQLSHRSLAEVIAEVAPQIQEHIRHANPKPNRPSK